MYEIMFGVPVPRVKHDNAHAGVGGSVILSPQESSQSAKSMTKTDYAS